jgi:hypothetical protein
LLALWRSPGRPTRKRRVAFVAPLSAAFAAAGVAVFAAVLLVRLTTDRGARIAGQASEIYSADGLELTVDTWQWMQHDMFGGPTPTANNFPMPAQMMPGMPADDVNRLHIEVTVTNRRRGPMHVYMGDFAVETAGGQQVKTDDSTVSNLYLDPQASMSGDLYFDIPLADNVDDVVFTTGTGTSVRIPFAGPAPQHAHGY